jgi:hypothetical protein
MELFGIVLSIPVAFVASMLYCLLLRKVVSKLMRLSRLLRITSYLVLSLFSIELVLLITIGAVSSRGLLGPGFYVAQVIFFFLCPPALANVLVLRPKTGVVSQWWVAGALCTVLAFCLVLLQYESTRRFMELTAITGLTALCTTSTTCHPERSRRTPCPSKSAATVSGNSPRAVLAQMPFCVGARLAGRRSFDSIRTSLCEVLIPLRMKDKSYNLFAFGLFGSE